MTRARVAVLMSTYDGDREAWVAEALDSLLAQTLAADIHFYLDGVSRPSLRELALAYAAKHPQVHLHEHPVNRGLAFALNDMLRSLGGRYDYFARMDADDVALPHRLEKQVAFLDAHPEVDVLGCAIIDIDEAGRELKRVPYPETNEAILQMFRKRNSMAHVTVVLRPSYLEKAGLYPEVRREDTLFWAQGFAAGCNFHNLPDALVKVRRSEAMLLRRAVSALTELRTRFLVNRRLRLGWTANVYAVAAFGVRVMPLPVKQALYNRLR